MNQRYFYCPKCGGRLSYKCQGGRCRLTCEGCGYIMYENPVVGVAAIILDDGKRILLGRRTNTYKGLWCIPCGYVEYDEDVYDAVRREFKEETNLNIEVTGVFSVQSNFHNPEVHTVGIWFWGRVAGGEMKAGDDIDQLAYFDLKKLPPMAFFTDKIIIEQLIESLERKQVC